jgi:signal transduction histidine kinase
MPAPLSKSPVASPPDANNKASQPILKERVAPGIFSRRIIRSDDIAPPAWWQHWLAGCLFTAALVLVVTATAVQFDKLLEPHFFAGVTMMVIVFLIALLWGAWPAVFATIFSTVALDYAIVEPISKLTFWSDLPDFLPFIVASLVISLLTAQRERARRRARTAERLANERSEALEEADKIKDQFLSLASHELKTPISAIKGYAQLAERRLGQVADRSPALTGTQEVLGKINQQADRLTGLVNDLLDVSRIQAGRLEFRLEPCDLAALCHQAVEEQQLASGRSISFVAPGEAITMSADSDRIGQVLNNLLTNALKYSDENRPVHMRLSRQGKQALVQIEDEGVGIPKDELPFIFDRFFRARTARSGPQRGLGLGLAICKEIIERHHGRIWATSEEGKGSTFTIELPLEGTPLVEQYV